APGRQGHRRCLRRPARAPDPARRTVASPPTSPPTTTSRLAVSQVVEILAEIYLLDHVDDQLLEALRGQTQRLAHRAQVRVLGEIYLAVRDVDGGDELQQPSLQVGRIPGERRHDLAPIESLQIE